MTFQLQRLEFVFGMVLAVALTFLAVTTLAFSPNPKSDSAAPSEAIYRAQHWNVY
jgi:hypothetical protein